jgi:hypothetical protein
MYKSVLALSVALLAGEASFPTSSWAMDEDLGQQAAVMPKQPDTLRDKAIKSAARHHQGKPLNDKESRALFLLLPKIPLELRNSVVQQFTPTLRGKLVNFISGLNAEECGQYEPILQSIFGELQNDGHKYLILTLTDEGNLLGEHTLLGNAPVVLPPNSYPYFSNLGINVTGYEWAKRLAHLSLLSQAGITRLSYIPLESPNPADYDVAKSFTAFFHKGWNKLSDLALEKYHPKAMSALLANPILPPLQSLDPKDSCVSALLVNSILTQLQSLNLKDTGIGDRTVRYLLETAPSLTHLDVSGTLVMDPSLLSLPIIVYSYGYAEIVKRNAAQVRRATARMVAKIRKIEAQRAAQRAEAQNN